MKNERLKIKKKADDGTRVITVRIHQETLAAVDKLAAESNYSRNERINILLAHGVNNVEID